jgi:DNA gyrase subunit B
MVVTPFFASSGPRHCCVGPVATRPEIRKAPVSDPPPPPLSLTFGQAVRRRPGMYAGDPGPDMLQHLIDELVSNVIDQYLRGAATTLTVRIRDDRGIEVADDGPGLPFDFPGPDGESSLATHHLLVAHSGGRGDNEAPHVHVHLRSGVGIAVVNHLSAHFTCRSWRGGRLWEQSFAVGEAVAAPRVVAEGEGRGTTFVFHPDLSIVGVDVPDMSRLRSTLWRSAHLFSGLKIHCGDERYLAPDGLADFVHMFDEPAVAWSEWSERPVFHWRGRAGDYAIESAASGVGGGTDRTCTWRSWVNGRSTPQRGSHVDAFAYALNQMGWEPATAMIHVITYDPRFAGPTRDRYTSEDACQAISRTLMPVLDSFCRAHGIDALRAKS